MPHPSSKEVHQLVAGGMRALAIRGPWWWFMLNGANRKVWENRPWYTKFRGDFLIHAGANTGRAEFDAACEFAAAQGAKEFPKYDNLLRGGIVGRVTLVDCVSADCFKGKRVPAWFEGPFGFSLANPRPLPFTPNRGMLGFYTPQF